MLFYDWKKIYKTTKGSSKQILTILEVMLRKSYGAVFPRNRFDPLYKFYDEDFSGTSFLINPEYLLNHRHRWRDKELADYIGLASFRNYGNYKLLGKTTLDLVLSPLGQDAINKNRLLHIDRDEIHFLYEDYTGE